MFIFSHVEDYSLKMQVANIMKDNANASIPELMTALQIGLGAKSRAIVMAEAKNMVRKNQESVQGFSLRVQDIQHRKYMADPDGKWLLRNETVAIETMDIFFTGLRSEKFVKECLRQNVKTLEDAVCVITNYVAQNIRLQNCMAKSGKPIPFSEDKELYLHPEQGIFYVNAMFDAGELDLDGNMAVEHEETVNAIVSANQCEACGMHKSHSQSDGKCPAFGKICYKCNRWNHFSSLCKLRAPQKKFGQTPAQMRHSEKVRRQKQLEARKINNIEMEDIEEEEEKVGAMGGSSDEEFTTRDVICTLKHMKKAGGGAFCRKS